MCLISLQYFCIINDKSAGAGCQEVATLIAQLFCFESNILPLGNCILERKSVSAIMNQVSPLSIAQITDIHLFTDEKQKLLGLPTTQSFQAVIEQLTSLQPRPDLLLLTGDLSQDGTPESYERLQNLLIPLAIPAYWLPGNHDCMSAMQQVLNRAPVSPRKAFTQGGWNFY